MLTAVRTKRFTPKPAVAVIGKLIEYVTALIEGGPAKLWEQVKADIKI